ncbi:MAG TPA: hypothetical protein VEU97_09960 [Ktedonobacteraceae bacterium]|nr:hypothetical protein [Ktedonobacteraceae bacterium]
MDNREKSAVAPTIQGETLVYLQIEQERELTVGTPARFAWLETVSTFSFVSEEVSSPLAMNVLRH